MFRHNYILIFESKLLKPHRSAFVLSNFDFFYIKLGVVINLKYKTRANSTINILQKHMRIIEVKQKKTKKISLYRSIKLALEDLNEGELTNRVYESLSRQKKHFENDDYIISRKKVK